MNLQNLFRLILNNIFNALILNTKLLNTETFKLSTKIVTLHSKINNSHVREITICKTTF